MAAQKGLGKGLEALFGDLPPVEAQPAPSGKPLMLPLQKVEPNPNQPRRDFDPEELQELSESIAQHGIIQPLTVRALDTGFYQIIAGERRWRAARLAGVKEVPVVVMEADDRTVMELALIENLQRSDLNPIDEAAGISSLMEQCGLTQENAAERLGKSRPAIANSLRLLTLPEEIRELLKNGTLSAGHARCLVPLETERQLELAKMAVEFGWSVRRLEQECARKPASERAEKPKNESTPELRHLERMARDVFGTKAVITGSEQSGKLTIPYKSAEDLQRIYELLETVQQNGG